MDVIHLVLVKASRSSVLAFTVSRYVAYGMLFLRSVLLAHFLGPTLFGVWGFLALVLTYLSYAGLGIHYAVNVELAIGSLRNDRTREKLIGTSLIVAGSVATLLILTGMAIQLFDVQLFAKFSFTRYALAIGVVAGLNLVQQVFVNIYRVYHHLGRIAVVELMAGAAILGSAVVFRHGNLISAVLLVTAITSATGLLVFTLRAPFTISWLPDMRSFRTLLAVGLPLLVYNASFYLITIVAQTVISVYYSRTAMGYYSFANTVATATLLGLNLVSWIFFPDVLRRTRAGLDDERVMAVVDRVNDLLGTSVFVAAFAAMITFPALFVIMPEFRSAQATLNLLLLSQAVLSVSFGYNCVAIARKKHMEVAKVSLLVAAVVTVASLSAMVFGLSYDFVSASVLIGALCFTALQVRISRSLLSVRSGPRWQRVLPFGMFLSVVLCSIASLAAHPFVGAVAGALVFAATSRTRIAFVWAFLRQRLNAAEGVTMEQSV